MSRIADPLRLAVARQILQRGLSTNPDSGCLAQVCRGGPVASTGCVKRGVAEAQQTQHCQLLLALNFLQPQLLSQQHGQ